MILSDLRFDSAADVTLRLQSTVCMYRDRPVYVRCDQRVRGANDLTVDAFDLLSQKMLPEPVHTSDDEFEVKAFPLGYINRNTSAAYISRMPTRKQRQGLSVDNTYVTLIGDSGGRGSTSISRDTLQSKALGEMILRQYPTVEEAYNTLKRSKHCKSVAFAPKLVLTEDEIGIVKLHYFTMPVAFYSRGVFKVSERFEHYIPILRRHDVQCEVSDA